jgi:Family of unknown function (DUF5335)
MQHTREIPREVWADYLTLVSTIERDHWVRVEATVPNLDEQTVAGRLPLVDISIAEKGSDEGTIEVTVGRPGEEITHRIREPLRVCAAESDDGEIECIDIQGSDQMKTLIYFEPMTLPEEVIAPGP